MGDAVAADEPLVELETDKVTIEVPAPAAGVLAEIAAKDGETVGVGALLGAIGDGARREAAPRRPTQRRRPSPKRSRRPPARPAPRRSRKPRRRPRRSPAKRPIEERKMPPAPAAAKLLAENNLAVDQVQGSGKRGQVLKGDVLDAIAKGAPSQPAEPPPRRRAAAPRRARPSPADDARAKSACG